jgi:hypothetical protein
MAPFLSSVLPFSYFLFSLFGRVFAFIAACTNFIKKPGILYFFLLYKPIVASNLSFFSFFHSFDNNLFFHKQNVSFVRRSEYLRMEDGGEVEASDVTSEVTGGDVTSEVTGGDVTSMLEVSDASSTGTDVNSDFEVCSSPQQGGNIIYKIFFAKNSICVEKNILFLTKVCCLRSVCCGQEGHCCWRSHSQEHKYFNIFPLFSFYKKLHND